MPKREKNSYAIQSVMDAFDLLETFAGEEGELGIVDLARRLALHKNTVFRLAATLETRGYLEQNKATGNYRLGLQILEGMQAFHTHRNLFSLAHHILEEIAARCNETAYLGVLRGRVAVYLDAVETNRPVRVALRVGTGLPVHCTAMGKVQLAFVPADVRGRLLEEIDLQPRTPHTITRREDLLGHLEEVRRRGYALDLDEYEDGVRCVAASVRNWTGRAVAGVSINGPSYRFDDARLEAELIPLVQEAAGKLSALLGWVGPRGALGYGAGLRPLLEGTDLKGAVG